MPDPDELDFENQEDEDDSPLVKRLRTQVKQLSKERDTNAEALARAEAAERKLLFIESGIPMNAKTRYFIEGYKGELTADAIKAEAVEAGFIEAPEPTVNPGEAAAHDQLAAASAGAGIEGNKMAAFNDRIAAATSEAEVMAILNEANVPTAWNQQ